MDLPNQQAIVEQVPEGAIFRHYKGKEYKIVTVGRHSEDLQLYVVYEGLYNCAEFGEHPVWVRPLDMFLEKVIINGKEMPRFERCR